MNAPAVALRTFRGAAPVPMKMVAIFFAPLLIALL
jgi:hypothetical protein